MASVKLSGAKMIVKSGKYGAVVTNGTLDFGKWYEVVTVGSSTGLPIPHETAVFKTPKTGSTAIALGSGDSVKPISEDVLCHTTGDISYEEGTIDVTDSCEGGFNAEILDGFTSMSGSINGFSQFDSETKSITTNVLDIFGRFTNIITDDSDSTYTVTEKENSALLLMLCLNKDAKIGEVQNWIIVKANLSSLAVGGGLKDAQKRDISWTKAQGYPSLYLRTVAAGDEL